MKKNILTVLFLVVCFWSFGQEHQAIKKNNKARKLRMQSPVVLEPGITASIFKYVSFNPVRIIHDKEKNVLYMPNQDGDIYQLSIQANGFPGTESLLISRNEHNINSLQGLEYHNNTFYLVGNQNYPSSYNGRGVVMKCTIQGSVKTWNTIAITELYPSSGTLYDHAFAGVSLSKNKDSLFVSSGSRTDHGEVKNSGSYIGLREVPLTAKIFVFPVSASNIYLYNDINYLKNNGYVYADGTRNEFDMAINGKGHLIGVENAGDRDDPEELNWLQKGKHYGFPWRMGGNDTPMQYPGYNASQDKLVPLDALNRGIFYDDPNYPQRPTNVTFVEPILNTGNSANWIRDPNSGVMYQGNISSFTSHRSPLGLVFDNDSTMAYPYNGNGFVFGYSHSADPFSNYLPTEDGGGDMTFLDLQFDSSINNYRLNTKKLISGLGNITDATLDGNIVYISELQGV